jgi:glycosyltransferase involved in cell wall biosynthesis
VTGLRLTYVIGSYPVLTETFIDREVEGLLSAGVDLRIISIRQPGTTLSPAQQAIRRRVTYLLPPSVPALIVSQLAAAIRHPRAYFGTIAWLLTRRHEGASRTKTLLHAVTGAHAAWVLRDRRGVHLHAHFVDRAATVALVASRLLGTTYSVTAHAADVYAHPALLKERIGEAAFAATCTEYNRRYLADRLGPAGQRVQRIYHGLPVDAYRGRRVHADGPRLLVAIGQLKEKKGLAYLIEACRLLCDRDRDVRCTIIGDGPLRPDLERQIADLGLADRVELAGAMPHPAAIDHLARAFAFVLPCVIADDGDRDGIPNAILEAMAMGLPVVSTPVSGIPEVVRDGETGYLVPERDAPALASAVERLLDDQSTADRMGAAGREFVTAEFDVERNLRRLLDAFTNVTSRLPGRKGA